MTEQLVIKQLGNAPYTDTWHAMRDYTVARNRENQDNSCDQLWVVEHPPVFTQGQAGKPEHILIANHNIPIVQTDRGGQVTYHGPGQIVVYLLVDIKKRKINIRKLVSIIETAVINTLNRLTISSYADPCAPGIYIDINKNKKTTKSKICSIGLRVKNGYTYHGLALNYDMDLTPFSYINPCGFNNLAITQIADLISIKKINKQTIINIITSELKSLLNYHDQS